MRKHALLVLLAGCGDLAPTPAEPASPPPVPAATTGLPTAMGSSPAPPMRGSGVVPAPAPAAEPPDPYTIATSALAGAGTFVLGVVGTTVVTQETTETENAFTAVPETGGVPTVIYRARRDARSPQTSLGTHFAFQPYGETVRVLRAGARTAVELPSSKVYCSALATSETRVYCYVPDPAPQKILAWSLGDLLVGPEPVSVDLGDRGVVTMAVQGTRMFLSREHLPHPLLGSYTVGVFDLDSPSAAIANLFDVAGFLVQMGKTRGLGFDPWHGCSVPWLFGPGATSATRTDGGCLARIRPDEDVAFLGPTLDADSGEPRRNDIEVVRADGTQQALALDPPPKEIRGLGVGATDVFWGAGDGHIRRAPRLGL